MCFRPSGEKVANTDAKADAIYHGGPILTMVRDGERAARISPSRTTQDRNIKITLHHDAPVAGIEMLTVAWSAVNRVTTSGKALGPEQRITPFEALRAITADAAWQNFEEDRKGTLETGKLADLVMLSHDPLAVDPMKIKDIRVVQTIKEGKSIFAAEG